MSSFPKIVGHIFLILQCLTPHTYEADVKDNLKEAFTIIKRIKPKSSTKWPICGAAWIGEEYLISAASCLDNNGKTKLNLKTLMDNFFDVEVFTNLASPDDNQFTYKGYGAAHPLYQRHKKKGFPMAYDVAVFKVDTRLRLSHVVADLCSKNKTQGYHRNNANSVPTAVALRDNFTTTTTTGKTPIKIRKGEALEYEMHGYDNTTTCFNGKRYFFDRSKQFVTHLKNLRDKLHKEVYDKYERFANTWLEKTWYEFRDNYTLDYIYFDPFPVGGPVFLKDPGEPKRRCIAGIMSFRAVLSDWEEMYVITSTKVNDDLIDWVEYIKKVLLDREKKPTKEGDSKFERQWWIDKAKNQQLGSYAYDANDNLTYIPAGSRFPFDPKKPR